MINIINILKNQVDVNDLKFYSPLFGDLEVNKTDIYEDTIVIHKEDYSIVFNEYGQVNLLGFTSPECLLFVKGKTWEDVLKSTFKSGDFLVAEFNEYNSFSERRGIHEYDWIYINDIDNNDFVHYGPYESVKDTSKIDMNKYHLLRDDEEYDFYKSFLFSHIFDNPSNPELFDDIILHLFGNESVKISSIDFSDGGFNVELEFDGRKTTYRVNMTEYRCQY